MAELTAEDLAEYGKTKTNLQEDPIWSSQSQELREEAWSIIQEFNVGRGIESETGEIVDPDAFANFQAGISDALDEFDIEAGDLSVEEQQDFVAAIFTEDELRDFGLPEETIQQYFGLEETAEAAGALSAGATAPTNTSLKYLQNALQMVSGVGEQEIGTSQLFEAAGLEASVPTLGTDLAQRMEEMNAVYDKYAFTVGDIAQAQLDTYNLRRSQFEDALSQFQRLEDYVLGLDADARAMENELSLYAAKRDIDAQIAAQEPTAWSFDEDLSAQFGVLTFTDEYGNFQFIDAEQSLAEGNMQIIPYTGTWGDNCVEYAREQLETQYGDGILPVGMDSIEGREDFVRQYGFTLSTGSPQEGDLVITNEGEWGHTAIITGFTSEGKMILEEANYRSGAVTQGRELSVDSPLVMGFWSPEQPQGPVPTTFAFAGAGTGIKSENEGINPGGAETFTTEYIEYTDTSEKTGEGGYTAIQWLQDTINSYGFITEDEVESARNLLQNDVDEQIFNDWYIVQGGQQFEQIPISIDTVITNAEVIDDSTGQTVSATDYYKQRIKDGVMTATEVEQELYTYEGANQTTVTTAMRMIGYEWDTNKNKWVKL